MATIGVYNSTNGWKFIRDEQSLDLEEVGGLAPIKLPLKNANGNGASDWMQQYREMTETKWTELWSGQINEETFSETSS